MFIYWRLKHSNAMLQKCNTAMIEKWHWSHPYSAFCFQILQAPTQASEWKWWLEGIMENEIEKKKKEKLKWNLSQMK